MKSVVEREELHKTIWKIANDLRGSVGGWDFKSYVLGFLFYYFICENLKSYFLNSFKQDYENLSDELPYSSEVLINRTKDTPNLLILEANIITDTNSHKGMLIGKEGATLKRIGKDARFKISKLAQKKVLLKLFVTVKKNWQKDEEFLKKLLNDEN